MIIVNFNSLCYFYHTSGVTENKNKKLEPIHHVHTSVLLMLIGILLAVVITKYDREHFLHHVSLEFVQRLEDRRQACS